MAKKKRVKRQQVWLIQSRISDSKPWSTSAAIAFDRQQAANLLTYAQINYPGIEYRLRKFVEETP